MINKTFRFLFFALLVSITNVSLAQDKIYLTDGTVLDAKVKEVSPRTIVYRQWNNQDGADYVLTRKEVTKIVYQNGVEEHLVMRRDRAMGGKREQNESDGEHETLGNKKGQSKSLYGNNILSFAPLQMTNEGVAGVGLQYERMLDNAGVFSLYLPVALTFFDDNVNYYSSGSGGYVNMKASRLFTNFYPGLKIYPAGSSRRFAYSIGPSFGFGFGTKYKQTSSIDPITGSTIIGYKEGSVFKTGFMVNNGLNFQPTKKLYIGLEFGLGFMYYNNENDNYSVGQDPMVQFNFKMGYRF